MLRLFRNKEKERKKAESIFNVMHDYYNSARSKYTNKKEIFYLSLAWAIYAKRHHPAQYRNYYLVDLLIIASSDTLIISYLNSPDSIDALSYYMIHKEKLIVEKEYEMKFNTIMSKINISESQIQQGSKEMVEYICEEMEKLEKY